MPIAQSSCRYELKNGLSVVGEFSWRARVTGNLRSYCSHPCSPPVAVRPNFPLPFRFILQAVQGHAYNPRPE
ncbi:hypothetical protein BYT27DRAFT_7205092 [Phlegmacium glaucopus]|nr:hypothetical protein BYT27DRAFT_7205092 [Phlegmacium glaucopus]